MAGSLHRVANHHSVRWIVASSHFNCPELIMPPIPHRQSVTTAKLFSNDAVDGISNAPEEKDAIVFVPEQAALPSAAEQRSEAGSRKLRHGQPLPPPMGINRINFQPSIPPPSPPNYRKWDTWTAITWPGSCHCLLTWGGGAFSTFKHHAFNFKNQ